MKANKLSIIVSTTIMMVVAIMFIASCELRPTGRESRANIAQVDLITEPDNFKQATVTVLVESYYSDSQMTG